MIASKNEKKTVSEKDRVYNIEPLCNAGFYWFVLMIAIFMPILLPCRWQGGVSGQLPGAEKCKCPVSIIM